MLFRSIRSISGVLFMSLITLLSCNTMVVRAASLPDPSVDDSLAAKSGQQSIVVSGGCFWGVQLVFQHVKGVISATSGYSGGSAKTAQYEIVSTGTTGHAESVKVVYDPSQVTLGRLLKVFFSVAHDPTQLNFQGPDRGTQYRSAIFYSGPNQQRVAQAYIAQLDKAGAFPQKIVTQVVPLQGFYQAEGYHQDYATHNPQNPYIMTYDLPKLDNLRKVLPDLYVKNR